MTFFAQKAGRFSLLFLEANPPFYASKSKKNHFLRFARDGRFNIRGGLFLKVNLVRFS